MPLIETHVTKDRTVPVPSTPVALERHVREMLADKISGTHVGLWFLVPEHLRLGTWDLLTGWTGVSDPRVVQPRPALQLVHEAALCVAGVRQRRTLRQKGFETLNGLPFVAPDTAMHQLLDAHTVAAALAVQTALAHVRRALGHYPGKRVLCAPHRIRTWSQRQMPPRKTKAAAPASKVLQTFFAIDGESGQPLGARLGSATVTVTQATRQLVTQLTDLLPDGALLVADTEHFTVRLLHALLHHSPFTFLMPVPRHKHLLKKLATLRYNTLWPGGYAVAETTHHLRGLETPLRLIVQRTGEQPEAYEYTPFVTSRAVDAATLMAHIYPERWGLEEFFNTDQALGWNRASPFNLNIRYGKLSLALIAQAAIHQLRQKLPEPMKRWTTKNLAHNLFSAIDGDIRVHNDTIVVTLDNGPMDHAFKEQYEHLPRKLEAEGINPQVPWLYNLKVDFRFK